MNDISDEFNPDSIVALPTGSSTDDFSHLLSGVDAETASAIDAEIKQGSFGAVNVQDFTDFNVKDRVVQKGEFSFAVEQRHLKAATDVTALTVSMAKSGFGAVKVTLFADKVRFSSFNQAAFSEIFIPTAAATQGLSEEVPEASFIFDQAIMQKIARSFGDAVISFTFAAEKQLLKTESGSTRLQFGTFSQVEFVDYHTRLGDLEYVGQIDPSIYQQGIQYVSMFSDRDEAQPQMSIISLANKAMVGGSAASVGHFGSRQFGDVEMRLKYEAVKTVAAMLPRFHKENTHLFSAPGFYVIRDENLYFGFEKTTLNFPDVAKILDIKAPSYTLAPRGALANSITRLSIVSVDRDLLIHFKLEGEQQDARLTLSTEDQTGKKSTDQISVVRYGQNVEPTLEFYVNAHALRKVIGHFDSSNVHLEVINGAAVRIVDPKEGIFDATTILTILTPESVAASRAAKEAARDAAKAPKPA